jgi:hypothetical protein
MHFFIFKQAEVILNEKKENFLAEDEFILDDDDDYEEDSFDEEQFDVYYTEQRKYNKHHVSVYEASINSNLIISCQEETTVQSFTSTTNALKNLNSGEVNLNRYRNSTSEDRQNYYLNQNCFAIVGISVFERCVIKYY